MAAAGAPQPVNRDNVRLSLQCPVSYEPYDQGDKQAVVLVARDALGNRVCGHTISRGVAERLFATTKICPICRVAFSDYSPNVAIQQLADDILRRDETGERVPAITATIPLEPEPDIDSIPFPGKGAHFAVQHPGWDTVRDAPGYVYREMQFISQTPDSVFFSFSVVGYRGGEISLFVRWKTASARSYLKQCNIQLAVTDMILCSSPSDTKKLLRILALHNEIPEPEFSLAKRLIEAGDWRQVTPRKP